MALSFNINVKTEHIFKAKLRLRVSVRQGKHAFAQECLYLQGIISNLNEGTHHFSIVNAITCCSKWSSNC